MGSPPPQRMCDQHVAEFNDLGDRQMPCRNSWCDQTWLWKRGAQLYQLQHQGKLRPPHRQCDRCFEEERSLVDREVPCKVPGCEHTWTWTRDAQARHRVWVRRQRAGAGGDEGRGARERSLSTESNSPRAERRAAEDAAAGVVPREVDTMASSGESVDDLHTSGAAGARAGDVDAEQAETAGTEEVVGAAAPRDGAGASAAADEPEDEGVADDGDTGAASAEHEPAGEGRKRKRRRRRKKRIHEGPPERMCESCAEKIGLLSASEQPCKVHGCTRTWSWDRNSQMRAWMDAQAAGGEDAPPPTPGRRMCESCREFVRTHPDREVACGRPGCAKTWTYKTGAQLQAALAGRNDPIRLCVECVRSQFVEEARPEGVPSGAEMLPCVVPGCTGKWLYFKGMHLMGPREDELPPDRMCDGCRTARGLRARSPAPFTSGADEPDRDRSTEHGEPLAGEAPATHGG